MVYSIIVLKDLMSGGRISKNLSHIGLCGGLSEFAPLVMVYEISRDCWKRAPLNRVFL